MTTKTRAYPDRNSSLNIPSMPKIDCFIDFTSGSFRLNDGLGSQTDFFWPSVRAPVPAFDPLVHYSAASGFPSGNITQRRASSAANPPACYSTRRATPQYLF